VILTFEKIKKEIYVPEAVEESADGSMPTMPTSGYGDYGRRSGSDERSMPGPTGVGPGEEEVKTWTLRRYDFLVQFCWQPQPRGDRLEKLAGEREEAPSTAAVDTEAADTGDSS
jgi:hypothetical protein